MRELIKPMVWLTILIVFSISMFTVTNWVIEWEITHNELYHYYPYGKACEFWDNCSKK